MGSLRRTVLPVGEGGGASEGASASLELEEELLEETSGFFSPGYGNCFAGLVDGAGGGASPG